MLNYANKETAHILRDNHAKRLEYLSFLLQELQRKQSYDVSEQPTPEEAIPWRKRYGGSGGCTSIAFWPTTKAEESDPLAFFITVICSIIHGMAVLDHTSSLLNST